MATLSHVLLIEADAAAHAPGSASSALAQQLATGQFVLAETAPEHCAHYFAEAVPAATAPSVIVIGPSVARPLVLARQVRAVFGSGHLVFVPSAANAAALQAELARASMLGSAWSLVSAGDPSILRQVEDAVRTVQRRVRLRTTLDRANVQISTPKAVDSVDYRRMVVSDRYLANFLMQAQDVIVSLDAAQRIMFVSAGASRLAGRTAAEMVGLPLRETRFWSEVIGEHLRLVHSARHAITAEIPLLAYDRALTMETVFSAVRDEAGQVIGTSLVMRDITERNRQLQVERAARAEAESIGRLKDDFLTTLSHELRTPLNAILGWAQLLQMDSVPEPKRQDGIATIERNARHQAKLIDDLLDVSSVMTGKLRLQLAPVSLRSIINGAAETVWPAILAKKLKLTVSVELAHDTVSGDAHRLQQVLWNLLSNAVKFTPAGGHIHVLASQVGDQIQVAVTDTGEGIDSAFQGHLFERFRQADASITRRKGGLGLGLSIVKQLTEMHGGSVSAYSAGQGHGATFTVMLPMAAVEPARATPAPGAALSDPHALQDVRILIVDDEADARAMIALLFDSHGARTLTCDSAAEALRAIEAFDPQLLISDIGMPDVDGYALLREVRTGIPNGDRLPAIALTAFADAAHREKALATGFQRHLGKPFQAAELLALAAELARAS